MRSRSLLLAALAIGGGATLTAAAGPSSPSAWVLLGTRAVNDKADHDVIQVTGMKGYYRSIKIAVLRAAVDFHRVVVHYGNGTSEVIELRNTIPAGGETRVIDLEGVNRILTRVEFWYDANTILGRRATVRLYGQR